MLCNTLTQTSRVLVFIGLHLSFMVYFKFDLKLNSVFNSQRKRLSRCWYQVETPCFLQNHFKNYEIKFFAAIEEV